MRDGTETLGQRLAARRARGADGARARLPGRADPDHRPAVVLLGLVLLLPAAGLQPALVPGLLHVDVLAAVGLEQPDRRRSRPRCSRRCSARSRRSGMWRARFPGQGLILALAHLADGGAGDHRRGRRLFRVRAARPDRRLCRADPRAHDAGGAVRRGHGAGDARPASTARCCAPRRASARGR